MTLVTELAKPRITRSQEVPPSFCWMKRDLIGELKFRYRSLRNFECELSIPFLSTKMKIAKVLSRSANILSLNSVLIKREIETLRIGDINVTLAELPNEIDPTQRWLIDCWSTELGVTTDAIRHAVATVGTNANAVRKLLKDGFRISIVDDEDVERLVARIRPQNGGFSISVPYHPARDGMVFKLPYDYSKTESLVPFDSANTFKVSARVKLSFHMDGFVQFSTAAQRKSFRDTMRNLKPLRASD